MTTNILREDRDRGFADWGVKVVLRRVSQTYDPESGALSESYVDRNLRAIVGEQGIGAAGGTAGHAGESEQAFAVRSEDVAGESDLRALRIVHAGREYRIHDVESRPLGGVTVLRCGAV